MIGRAISHYRVLESLGAGGMGVVYLAEDGRLGRQVALKFLPPEATRDETTLERFRIEARAASSLSHPGICTVFDIGDDGGSPFIVMEALKGETLRDRIKRGPLKVPEVLDIGVQLADALEAAHSQGIVHRDIKPGNIFVGDKNRVKILDFGLAKLVQTANATATMSVEDQLTMPGSTLGTVSYMSPEQARGEEVDGRSDLFSLGTVLYEMAAGVQAFGGSTPGAVIAAILIRPAPSIVERNAAIPPRLEEIIGRALEKDRELRYQHAGDLLADLKRLRRDIDINPSVSSLSRSALPSMSSMSPTMVPTRIVPAPLPDVLPSSTPSVAPGSQAPSPPVWRVGIAGAAGAAAVLAIALGALWMWRPRAEPPAPPAAQTSAQAPAPAAAQAAPQAAPAAASPAPGQPEQPAPVEGTPRPSPARAAGPAAATSAPRSGDTRPQPAPGAQIAAPPGTHAAQAATPPAP
jgi:serine/threonine protein kinase